jgi:uncharacterized protein (DUF2062 family)
VPEWVVELPRPPGRERQIRPRFEAARTGVPVAAGVRLAMARKKNKRPGHPWRERARRWGRYIYLRLVRQNDEPDKVAKGVGLGVFLGIFPTFGVGAILAVLIATWVKWNRASAALGTLIMNPFFNPFFVSLSVVAGNLVVPPRFRITVESFRGGRLWTGFFHAVPVYLLGNILVSTIFALLAYELTLGAVKAYRERRAARQTLKGRGASPPELPN